jgi:peptidoglycan/LPS O-acetylase OafA/YrhL
VYVFPLTFVLLAPLVQRNSIPLVGEFEAVGRRSYGLYLTHLLVIDLLLLAVQEFAPWMFGYHLLLAFSMFAVAMALPLFVMNLSANTPARTAYRYVFG